MQPQSTTQRQKLEGVLCEICTCGSAFVDVRSGSCSGRLYSVERHNSNTKLAYNAAGGEIGSSGDPSVKGHNAPPGEARNRLIEVNV